MSVSDAYTQLMETVHTTRRAWRARRIVEGVLLTAAVGVGALIAATVLDHVFALGMLGRCVVAALMWAAVIVTGWRAVAHRALRPHSDDYFAALLEQRLPQLGNRLINGLQLGRTDAGAAPPRLIEAVVTDGVRATDELDPGRAISGPALRRHGLALAIVAALGALYIFTAGPAARTAMARVLMPTANIAPFTWTRLNSLDLTPGNRLLEGRELTITANTTGRAPHSARIHWTTPDGRARSAAMNAADEHQFTHTFNAVGDSFDFHVTAGDMRTDRQNVTVDPRPRIAHIDVTYTPPQYTGLDARTENDADGHLRGLPDTTAQLTWHTNKPLDSLIMQAPGGDVAARSIDDTGMQWRATITLNDDRDGAYKLLVDDRQRYEPMHASTTYTIALDQDQSPYIGFIRPAQDVQRQPDGSIAFAIRAEDDYGLGEVALRGYVNDQKDQPITLQRWPHADELRRADTMTLERTISELNLDDGDKLEYWAEVVDRNNVTGPGRDQTKSYYLNVRTPEQSQSTLDAQLSAYAKIVADLIKLQKQNRAATAEYGDAAELIQRQGTIRETTQKLADTMEQNAFPAQTMVEDLRTLAADPMVQAITLLESYRDAADLSASKPFADKSLPVQDEIIATLEEILVRLNRAEQTRQLLRKKKETDPEDHEKVERTLEDVHKKLDDFLSDVRELEEEYEKLPKRGDRDQVSGETLEQLQSLEKKKLEEWKEWTKDSVDAITKLPDGFVPDAHLAENVSTIFEEIDKQPRGETREIATPVEEGAKALAEEVAEDLEMWMPHSGDSTRWVMESPPEGRFEVPETKLPSQMQDRIGELIEDASEFDDEADDITGAWGGNMQVGWDIQDGPISSFAARGKTGNQLPNESEMSGRSGSGRRGRASGQMVGSESKALEGRPTPARVTNEPYEEGKLEADEQLDPRGATGGGKKTGGGQRGLQGGTPPDFVKDMDRLADRQQMLREKAQQIARELDHEGRPLSQVHRSIELMEQSEQDLRDLRYRDAARKRKQAIDSLRAAESGVDHAVNLSLQKARNLPPEMRDQISSGSQQALPEGYEDIVGGYYKALSEGENAPTETDE